MSIYTHYRLGFIHTKYTQPLASKTLAASVIVLSLVLVHRRCLLHRSIRFILGGDRSSHTVRAKYALRRQLRTGLGFRSYILRSALSPYCFCFVTHTQTHVLYYWFFHSLYNNLKAYLFCCTSVIGVIWFDCVIDLVCLRVGIQI